MSTRQVDVAIVGAGAAGLGAARAARERGLSFIVLEAMDRSGGRAHTDTTTFGVPWDRGCHWLHSASVNPFRALAQEYGFTYVERPPIRGAQLLGRPASEGELTSMFRSLERQLAQIEEAGRRGDDVPASTVVNLSDRWLPLLRTALAGEWGVDLTEVSTRDDAAYRNTDENWPVQEGYGALIARHAAGIPIELGTPVERVAWGGPTARVVTGRGEIEARTVLITVSTRVIQDEVIAFDPPLPAWKREAYEAIRLGNANKVTFGIDGRHLGVEEPTSCWVQLDADQGMWMQLRPFGFDLASGYLAGALGEAVEREGEAAMLALGREALVRIFGNDIIRHIALEACTMWQTEPWIRGAYGAARPGRAHLRPRLAIPLDDQLFFAGEATSRDWFSTAHGAHLTGVAAIDAIVAVLSREPASSSPAMTTPVRERLAGSRGANVG